LGVEELHNSGRYRVCARGVVEVVIPIWQRRVLLLIDFCGGQAKQYLCVLDRCIEEQAYLHNFEGGGRKHQGQPKDRVAPKEKFRCCGDR